MLTVMFISNTKVIISSTMESDASKLQTLSDTSTVVIVKEPAQNWSEVGTQTDIIVDVR